jgi:hypothetical protein
VFLSCGFDGIAGDPTEPGTRLTPRWFGRVAEACTRVWPEGGEGEGGDVGEGGEAGQRQRQQRAASETATGRRCCPVVATLQGGYVAAAVAEATRCVLAGLAGTLVMETSSSESDEDEHEQRETSETTQAGACSSGGRLRKRHCAAGAQNGADDGSAAVAQDESATVVAAAAAAASNGTAEASVETDAATAGLGLLWDATPDGMCTPLDLADAIEDKLQDENGWWSVERSFDHGLL